MASNDSEKTMRHDEEATAPPEGMYWVQMQGLWALRPIVDPDYTDEQPSSNQCTERSARSTLEQQRALLTDADRQWLAQSAGAPCSTAAASVDASAPTVGEGSSRPERLPRANARCHRVSPAALLALFRCCSRKRRAASRAASALHTAATAASAGARWCPDQCPARCPAVRGLAGTAEPRMARLVDPVGAACRKRRRRPW